jgi:3-oxoacyl-[acyl-carrier-protein] synthase-3
LTATVLRAPAEPRRNAVAARIRAIATYLPETILDNEALATIFPDRPADKIFQKLGIRERRIAAEGETATDLAFAAACRLFDSGVVAGEEIDFLLLCTQAPDYILPTSACVLQARLGLATTIGAFDINLGCSGFVYGLSIATGMIASGAARNVLLLTADTYSKFINPGDRSVRTLFGDGAAATLISPAEPGDGAIGPFVFGTDGRGASSLIVSTGGARHARTSETAVVKMDATGNSRARDDLFMNGAGVMSFSLKVVPPAIREVLDRSGLAQDDIDYFILHQANKFMLDALTKTLRLPLEKVPRFYETVGNTVSSSIPFLLEDMIERGSIVPGARVVLVGFGVGLSWSATLIQF